MIKKKINPAPFYTKRCGIKHIIGIDEVGRGAIAGIVTVGAVLMPAKFKIQSARWRTKIKIPLKDSKKLSAKQREIWFEYIKKSALSYRIASVSPKIIDKINISNAANLAATRALKRLIKNYELRIKNCKIYLDGGLYLNGQSKNQKKQNFILTLNKRSLIKCKIFIQTVIGGDTKISAISLASIVAKVSRDRYMKKLHKKYPQYDFIHNVGYGTKKHIRAIKKYGLSSIHRKSFKI